MKETFVRFFDIGMIGFEIPIMSMPADRLLSKIEKLDRPPCGIQDIYGIVNLRHIDFSVVGMPKSGPVLLAELNVGQWFKHMPSYTEVCQLAYKFGWKQVHPLVALNYALEDPYQNLGTWRFFAHPPLRSPIRSNTDGYLIYVARGDAVGGNDSARIVGLGSAEARLAMNVSVIFRAEPFL